MLDVAQVPGRDAGTGGDVAQRRPAPASLLVQPGADLVLQIEPGHALAVRVGHQNSAGQDTISSSSGSSARDTTVCVSWAP